MPDHSPKVQLRDAGVLALETRCLALLNPASFDALRDLLNALVSGNEHIVGVRLVDTPGI